MSDLPPEHDVTGTHFNSQDAQAAREYYLEHEAAARQAISDQASLNLVLQWVRMALFLIGAAFLVLGYSGSEFRGSILFIGWAAMLGFFIAIVWHEHLRLKELKHQSDVEYFQHLLARLDRNWSEVSTPAVLPRHTNLSFADDLDIFGEASLLSLVSLAGTPLGKGTLQDWLARPPATEDVVARQTAVKALTPERAFRMDVIKTVRATHQVAHDDYGLPDWAQSPNWLPLHPLARLLSYLGPGLMIASIVLLIVAVQSDASLWMRVGAIGVIFAALLNIFVTVFWGGLIHEIFLKVTGEHLATFEFERIFASFEDLPRDGGILEDIRQQAINPPNSACQGFAKLHWLVRVANMQREPMLYFVYLVLQLLFLWDFRVLKRLERWKTVHGQHVANWFEALGRCEALISLATLADEYPKWTYPVAVDTVRNGDSESPTNVILEAKELGHPLLPDEARIPNDISFERDKPLLLVTGSNMAGKSTFLRAVGLNIVLARCGGPVCASEFKCAHYELATSIRIRDSLRDGVSFFMAELKRLKEVVDLAELHHAPREEATSKAPVLFLLDEILQGTNSAERLIAVTQVLTRLINVGAVGMVSTHDLDLADGPEIATVSQIVHFREYFEQEGAGEVMKFDYRLRPGTTPTTNALKLLEIVGLGSKTP